MTQLSMKPITLSRRQQDTLHVVSQYGPLTASDVAYHLLIDTSAARYDLSRMERLRLVEATYTNVQEGHRGRGYVVTERGEEVVRAPARARAREGAGRTRQRYLDQTSPSLSREDPRPQDPTGMPPLPRARVRAHAHTAREATLSPPRARPLARLP